MAWGTVSVRSWQARALWGVVALLLIVWVFTSLPRRGSEVLPDGILNMTEQLRVDSTRLALTAHSPCTVQQVPWHIDGYGARSYQIEWTVSRDKGRAWTWRTVTGEAESSGRLQVLICPAIAGSGRSTYTITGVLDAVTLHPLAAGTAAPSRAGLTVDVTG
jgi:hypothetical protein